ncbi:MAG TPA: TIR domain-containing protein [Thermoanaerobaculia bacterium]|nr:TIR domain-containing protein [Thermoanaerobaculia bacterium]
MDLVDELNAIAGECDRVAQLIKVSPLSDTLESLDSAIKKVAESSSNSWIGYQSRVYYRGFRRPAPGDHFSIEWGFEPRFSNPTSDNWQEVDFDTVNDYIMRLAGNPDIVALGKAAKEAAEIFEQNRDELINILTVALDQSRSSAIEELRGEVKALKVLTSAKIIDSIAPVQVMTRDYTAFEQGRVPPHHVRVGALLGEQRHVFKQLEALAKLARRVASLLRRQATTVSEPTTTSGPCVFIGHGRDPQWKDVGEFIEARLGLKVEEFNRHPAAGLTTKERLEEMLAKATFAFLIMTAEDEHADASLHARENVIHEIGLFQNRLGFRRAIVVVEDGCREFSNISGVTQLRFPKGYIKATFEEIRQVLEREGMLPTGSSQVVVPTPARPDLVGRRHARRSSLQRVENSRHDVGKSVGDGLGFSTRSAFRALSLSPRYLPR